MPTGELLERAPQLEKLHACLRSARSGAGRMIFAGGEAGIGKTALVRRFCLEIATDVRVLMGGCDAMATPRPLAPLFDVASGLGARSRGDAVALAHEMGLLRQHAQEAGPT